MTKTPRLTLAFLEHAPSAAAAVLHDLPIDETAAFLESVPARLAAPAVNAMTPWHGARCLEALSRQRAAMILRELSVLEAASLVRLLKPDDVDAIVDELPGHFGRRLRTSLRYPLDQVGAWIDHDVPCLRAEDSVRHAQRVLCDAEAVSHIFVESDEMFAGCIEIRNVLRADPNMLLGQLPYASLEPVANRASLASVDFDERWDRALHLPVIGRRGNLLGGLSRHALRKGIHEHHVTAAEPQSLIRHLCGALVAACAGIVDFLVQAEAPAIKRVEGETKHGS